MRMCEARDVKLGAGPAMTTFIRKNVDQLLKKRPIRGGKSDVGGPEKQLILFVWPYNILLAIA